MISAALPRHYGREVRNQLVHRLFAPSPIAGAQNRGRMRGDRDELGELERALGRDGTGAGG